METWVLFIALYGTGRALAVVPGYDSKEACEIAASQVRKHNIQIGVFGQIQDAIFCFPGPKKIPRAVE